jgi:hypothetical protein
VTVVIAALIVAAAAAWGARLIAAELGAAREDAKRARTLSIVAAFAPAIAASQTDPRVLLTWQPLAKAARALFPDEFAALDRAAGSTFPFDAARLSAAHAQWTADWLAWEAMHDAEYKKKAAEVEHDRARLDLVERQKLDAYQRRYEEYVRVAKALQQLSAA